MVYLDLHDLTGDHTPVLLEDFIRDNSEPGVVPLDSNEVARLQALNVGERTYLAIGGGSVVVARLS